MVDYALTDLGRAFIHEALLICNEYGLSWSQLWLSGTAEAETARRALNLFQKDAYPDPDSASRLFGAYAVVQTLQSIAKGEEDLQAGVALLGRADLLNDANIEVAADTFGLSPGQVWDLFIPER